MMAAPGCGCRDRASRPKEKRRGILSFSAVSTQVDATAPAYPEPPACWLYRSPVTRTRDTRRTLLQIKENCRSHIDFYRGKQSEHLAPCGWSAD